MGMLNVLSSSAKGAMGFQADAFAVDVANLVAKSETSTGMNMILAEVGMVALLPKSVRKRKTNMAREGKWGRLQAVSGPRSRLGIQEI